MKEFTIKYTRTKQESMDEPFAILKFVVYNERELEEVLKNIEEHFDGIIIETNDVTETNRRKSKKK